MEKNKVIKLYQGKSVPRGKLEEIREKPGKSNAGKYKNLKKSQFAGSDGTYPINDLAHARNALSRAHFASNPSQVKKKVYEKYPQLKKSKDGKE